MVGVAEGDSDGVGDVGWTRRLRQPEGASHRLLDLLLARPAIPGQCALHLRGGVVMERNVVEAGHQADHAARVPHEDGGSGMLVMRVELLQRHGVWPML